MSEAAATYRSTMPAESFSYSSSAVYGRGDTCGRRTSGRHYRARNRVAESRRLSKFPESLLHAAWRRAGSDSATVAARDGHTYRIIYAGRPADGSGPDFRDAVLLRDDGKRVHGHVEIHVRTGDWHRHGHGSDPAYNGVALHVVLEDEGHSIATPSGIRIPLLVLKRKAIRPVSDSKATAEPGPIESKGDTASVQAALPLPSLDMAAAGDAWFRNRSHAYRMQFTSTGFEQALWEGTLECLGYPSNKKGFRQLAVRFPRAVAVNRLQGLTVREIEAVLKWAAGFAPRPDCADEFSLPGRSPDWNRRHGRPANSPKTRLRAAAAWAFRWRDAESLSSVFTEAVKSATSPGKLSDLFIVRPQGYKMTPLGLARAREIVVNHLLPSIHALAAEHDDLRLARRAEQLFRIHPKLSSNGITREASCLLKARGVNGDPSSAREQQGLIHIYRTAVTPQRGEQQLPLV